VDYSLFHGSFEHVEILVFWRQQ